jgi:hypothetical protein
MEFKEKSRLCSSKDSLIKMNEDKNKIEKIKKLIIKLKKNENLVLDISIYIIQCFIQEEFKELNVNEIINAIKEYEDYENSTNKYNIRNDVMNAIKNNEIFHQGKKRYKYALNLEKTINYLISYLDSRSNSINTTSNNMEFNNIDSKKSKLFNSSISSPVFNFPENQNNTIYFQSEESPQKLSNSNMDETCFTFGEQSQIKVIKNPRKDEEEIMIQYTPEEIKNILIDNFTNDEFKIIENKAIEKYIPEFEVIFDGNNYFSNLEQNYKKVLIKYKNNNTDKNALSKFENCVNNINLLMNDLKIQKIVFNEKSFEFNEQKSELFNMSNVIFDQYKLLKIVIQNIFIPEEFVDIEKKLFQLFQKNFNDLFALLQKNYKDIKSNEIKIKDLIHKIKESLRILCDDILKKDKSNKEYQDFLEMAKNYIENDECSIIRVNINETVKLFYCYINEFKQFFSNLDKKIKKRKEHK